MTLQARIALVLQAIGADIKSLLSKSIPAGGTSGQALVKTSSTDYAVSWATIISSLLAGYTSTTGTVAVTDTIVGAIGKLNGNIGLKSDLSLTLSAKTSNYTLVLADNGKMIQMNLAASNTLTIPTNTSVAFPIGTQIIMTQEGTGQTTITPASGVTLNSAGSKMKTNIQYSTVTMIKKATNTWLIAGDLTA